MNEQANPVLIPIDMQQGFDVDGGLPSRWNSRCDENGRRLLSHWREMNWPIVHVRHDSVEPNSVLRPGQPGNDFRIGFEPVGDEPVVSKSVNSAFIGTDLDLRLRRCNASKLVFFGMTTDQCVSTTVRVGANMGWSCILIEDACDCFELPGRDGKAIPAIDLHAAHVATLAFEFCEALTTENILLNTA